MLYIASSDLSINRGPLNYLYPLLNLKTAAITAQTLFKASMNNPLFFVPSKYVGLTTLLAEYTDFYTQKKTPLSSLESLLRNYPSDLSVSISIIG